MLALPEMPGSVFILRRIAATDLSALQAHAQMNLGIAYFYAVLADMFICGCDPDLIDVAGFGGHGILLSTEL